MKNDESDRLAAAVKLLDQAAARAAMPRSEHAVCQQAARALLQFLDSLKTKPPEEEEPPLLGEEKT